MNRILIAVLLAIASFPALAATDTTTVNGTPHNSETLDASNVQAVTVYAPNGVALPVSLSGSGGSVTANQGTAASSGPWLITPWIGGAVNASSNPLFFQITAGSALMGSATAVTSGALSSGTSTLTSGTATAITATNNFIASSTTAGSVVVPSFSIANSAGGALAAKFNLTTSATSGWNAITVYVNLYSAAPTYTIGDGGVWAPTVASGAWVDQYTCTFTQMVTNAQAICIPVNGTVSLIKLASGASVYWDIVSQSTVTKASGQTFAITSPLLN